MHRSQHFDRNIYGSWNKMLLKCYRRRYVMKLSYPLVSMILTNEREKFPHFEWLRKMEFSDKYVSRFLLENDLVFSSQKSDQSYIGPNQLDSHRKIVWKLIILSLYDSSSMTHKTIYGSLFKFRSGRLWLRNWRIMTLINVWISTRPPCTLKRVEELL